MASLAGRTALITGASSGIGRATAERFLHEGADVALVARRAAALDAVASEGQKTGRRAVVVVADLAEPSAARGAVATAVGALGRLDIIVQVAGTNVPRRALADLSPDDWQGLLAVNLTAAFHVTQAALPLLREQGGGLIIYVASYAVQRPDRSGVAYQASKHGLVGLAHGTSEEEGASGIRTTVIFPGMTDTPILDRRPTPTTPEARAAALRPEDVATACLFVASLPPRARVPELQIVPSTQW